MTRKEIKNEILKKMNEAEFNERMSQLINWNTQTQALNIIYNELSKKMVDANEVAHHIYYEIG